MDETRKPPRLRQVDRTLVRPAVALDDLVDADHPVRAVWEYVASLDLTALLSLIRAVEGSPGRNATDPRILLSLWIWATSDGVGSARKLAKLCDEHHAYRWLCGGVSLNYHTLADFRSGHGEILDGLLERHVAALLHHGLIELSCVAQDGMRTRASAGGGSFRRSTTIEECQRLTREQVEELKPKLGEPFDAVSRREAESKKRHLEQRLEKLAAAKASADELTAKNAERTRKHPKEAKEKGTENKPGRGSTTDPDARPMKMADGGIRPGYNVQCAATTDTRIIVGVAVTNQGADGGLMGAMVDQIEEAYGCKPERVLVDGGYSSKADVESLHDRQIKVYTPLKNAKKDLDAGKNPHGAKPGDRAGMEALRQRMSTAEAKEQYKQRSSTAEWVNAGMRQRGLYQFTVRGLAKVTAVAVLQALVHNLWQTLRLLARTSPGRTWREILRAETGKAAGQAAAAG